MSLRRPFRESFDVSSCKDLSSSNLSMRAQAVNRSVRLHTVAFGGAPQKQLRQPVRHSSSSNFKRGSKDAQQLAQFIQVCKMPLGLCLTADGAARSDPAQLGAQVSPYQQQWVLAEQQSTFMPLPGLFKSICDSIIQHLCIQLGSYHHGCASSFALWCCLLLCLCRSGHQYCKQR